MDTAIHIDSVCKTYRKTPFSAEVNAVKDVSLSVQQGEVFGFIGPNGAGKTTTIKMIMGLIRPTLGQVSLFGISAELPDSRLNVGYVPENPSLYEYSTPLEMLSMAIRLHRIKVKDEKQHCMTWLERFDLAGVANKTIRSFSKGMAQRTALAHAMVIEPRLLILDEPLSGLDPIGRRDVVNILSEYRQSGGTVFLTSHVLHDVERLADRFGLIHNGEMATVRSPADLLQDEKVVLIRSFGERAVDGFVSEPGGRWVTEVASDQLWAVFDRLRQAGHSVLEVKPALSLERVFLQVVGKQ
jgi:ABC-2 type transport system ATP-binding protein